MNCINSQCNFISTGVIQTWRNVTVWQPIGWNDLQWYNKEIRNGVKSNIKILDKYNQAKHNKVDENHEKYAGIFFCFFLRYIQKEKNGI